MSINIRPGLYFIKHVLNRDLDLFSLASSRRQTGSPIFGSVEESPEFIQQWEVIPSNDAEDMYLIMAPPLPGVQPVGFAVKHVGDGAPVFLSPEPKPLRIQLVENESSGPESAYSVMFPAEHGQVGASFYMEQRPTKEAEPPVILTAIPVIADPPPAPFWVFTRA